MSFFDKFKKNQIKDKKIDKETKKPAEKKDDYSTLKPKGETVSSKNVDKTKTLKEKELKAKTVNKADTKDAYRILIKPLVTEKAASLAVINKYCFEVAKSANKIEVKKAIENLYGVRPLNVNFIISKGKKVHYGRITGKQRNWKKAIITLKPGEKIEIYEGV